MRKNIFAVIFGVAVAVGNGACSSAWWSNFKADPVAYVTTFEQQVQTILSTAATIFNAIRPFIPTDKLAQIEKDYNAAVFAATHGLAALNDAVQAAVVAQTPTPDFSKLINDVVAAVDQMTAIVDEFRTGGSHVAAMPQVQSYPAAFDDIKSMKASIDKYKK